MEQIINKLPDKFIGTGEVNGFNFTKIKSSDTGFLYQISTDDNYTHYEIFERKLSPICLDFENRIYSNTEFKEVYPKTKDFGDWAWTTKDFDRAIEIFDGL